MTKQDFHVGQTVYLFHAINYRSGATIEERIIEVKVISVGRKYLAVDYFGRMEFDMTNNFREKSIYNPNFTLFLTKEEIYQMIETNQTRQILHDRLERYVSHIPMEGLQEIMAVIDKYTESISAR